MPRYYKRIYHLAYLKTNNAQDAEDVASETFVRALASLGRFRLKDEHPSFYPWLHRIALNLIVDSCRQRPPSGIVSLDAPVIEGMRTLLDSPLPGMSASPQEIVERHEVQQLVRSAIAALPADQGDVLIYRFLGDLSAKEIAPLLGRSEAAVKSLLHRAVVSLKREIERRVDARGAFGKRARAAGGAGREAACRTRLMPPIPKKLWIRPRWPARSAWRLLPLVLPMRRFKPKLTHCAKLRHSCRTRPYRRVFCVKVTIFRDAVRFGNGCGFGNVKGKLADHADCCRSGV